jgi:hypothetical protein
MAAPTDPAFASIAAAFPADEVRAALRFAMQMGTPNNVADQLSFRWTAQPLVSGPTDQAGRPLRWTQPLDPAAPPAIADKRVTCLAVQGKLGDDWTTIGPLDPTTLTVLLLDTEYDELVAHGGRLPDQAVMSNVVYFDVVEAQVQALFGMDVHRLEAHTTDVGSAAP